MTDREDEPDHQFSEGGGFEDPYEGFDLDPPELDVDPAAVDPVDSRSLADMLDERQIGSEDVDADDLVDVGLSYMGINRFEQATEAFERAARFADDAGTTQEAWVNKGVAHGQLGEWDEAIGAHREAIATDGATEQAASAHTNLAFALWESGDTTRALEHAEKAVEVDDRLPQAWYNRAFFLAERGLHEDALQAIDNAIRLGHRSADVLDEKARILEELGEDEEAEAVAEEANERRERAEQRMLEEQERVRE